MYMINWITFIIITFVTTIIAAIFYFREKRSNRKLLYVFTTISVYIYSGIGMSFNEIDGSYIYKYFTFLFFLLVAIACTFISANKNVRLKQRLNKRGEWVDILFWRYKNAYFYLSVIFILTIFINLLIPTLRINQFWNPPTSTLVDIFARREAHNLNVILKIADTLNLMLLPFFFIHLYGLIEKGKKLRAFMWMAIWLYLDYLRLGYWGRYEIVVYTVFVFLALFALRKEGIKIVKFQIIWLVIGVILLVPFLQGYESYRLGASSTDMSLSETFSELFQSEADYPKYYPTIENQLVGIIRPIDLASWLIFLPVPSILWSGKPTIAINETFTYAVTGIASGASGYSVALPSLLGEAFMIWGMTFYWIHAIILGVLIACFCVLYEKSKVLSIVNLYYIVFVIVIGRSGYQSYLSTLINGSISIVIWIMLINRLNKRKHSASELNTN